MVQIAGKYEFVSQENYKEYLISLGLSEEQANKRAESKPSLTISPVEGGKITISYFSGEATFTLNEEVEHVAAGHKVWTTVLLNGDTLTLKTKFVEDGSAAEEKVLKITDTGLTATSTNTKGVKTVVQYKRV